jgi:hypothetical protein
MSTSGHRTHHAGLAPNLEFRSNGRQYGSNHSAFVMHVKRDFDPLRMTTGVVVGSGGELYVQTGIGTGMRRVVSNKT